VSSGGIQLIETDSLRLAVAQYEREILELERSSDRAWATWAERIQPHLEGRVPRVDRLRGGSYGSNIGVPFGVSPFAPDFEAVFSDSAFESMVAERWIRIDQVSVTLDRARSLMNEIVAMIDQESVR
jgi:hypothetical protein